jgi:hypothetical protein
MLNHFRDLLSELALRQEGNSGEMMSELTALSEIFNFPDFTEKASIFIQIAILGKSLLYL